MNARLRDECLDETIFTSLIQARSVIAAWRHDYHYQRDHSGLGSNTPAERAAHQRPSKRAAGSTQIRGSFGVRTIEHVRRVATRYDKLAANSSSWSNSPEASVTASP